MNPKRFDVWVSMKDGGSANGILPVVDLLIDQFKLSVLIIADGRAKEMLELEGKRAFVTLSPEELLAHYTPPAVLISGMCGKGTGRNLVPLLRGKSTIVAAQDYWGGQLWLDWAAEEFRPDYIWVNDAVGKAMVLEAWPQLAPDRVLVTGFPAFDKYVAVDVAEEDRKVRETLGLEKDLPLVLFGGQAWWTGDMLAEVVEVLNAPGYDCYFMPRPHPNTKKEWPEEMAKWQRALARFRGRLVVDWFGACTPSSLIAACAKNGVVVSMFSTMLAEAACLRAQNIAMLYPEKSLAEFKRVVPWKGEYDISVPLGCAAIAENRQALRAYVQRALHAGLGNRHRQIRHFRGDGKNALRAAIAVGALTLGERPPSF